MLLELQVEISQPWYTRVYETSGSFWIDAYEERVLVELSFNLVRVVIIYLAEENELKID